jgi:predicted transposase/invertase (TIGR01784 family)
MAERGNPDKVLEGMEIVLVELKKFKPAAESERQMSDLWVRFLREMDKEIEKAPDDLFAASEICEAIDICEKIRYTYDELVAYETYWEAIGREKEMGVIHKAEGLIEGKARRARKIALSMLKKGFSLGDISEMTDLSAEEIDGLRKELPAIDKHII